ncbi:MAG: hypothetical protein ACRDZN_12780 [Acidimicrobiales bacterium]
MADDRHCVRERRSISSERVRSLAALGAQPLLRPHLGLRASATRVDGDASQLVGLDDSEELRRLALGGDGLARRDQVAGAGAVARLPSP